MRLNIRNSGIALAAASLPWAVLAAPPAATQTNSASAIHQTGGKNASAIVDCVSSAQPQPGTTGGTTSGTTGSGASIYQVILHPEPNNGGLIAADTYLMNSEGRRVKQVGHAEVASAASSGTSTGGADYQADSSSPFPFELAFSGDPNTQAGSQGTLVQDGLFAGTSLSNLQLSCRINGPSG